MTQPSRWGLARLTRATAVTAVLLLGAGRLYAQGTTGKVEGTVRDQSGAPIAGAQVLIVGSAFSSTTNEQGYYFLNNVPAGVMTVRTAQLAIAKRLARSFHMSAARVLSRRETIVRRRGMRKLILRGVVRYPELLQPELVYEIASGGGKPGFIDAFNAILDYDFSDRLPAVEQPTLIVWGRNDRIVPVGGAYRYEQLIPDSSRFVLEDTGHVPMIERPALFNRLLEGFLTE